MNVLKKLWKRMFPTKLPYGCCTAHQIKYCNLCMHVYIPDGYEDAFYKAYPHRKPSPEVEKWWKEEIEDKSHIIDYDVKRVIEEHLNKNSGK
jgi:hypothetical protein